MSVLINRLSGEVEEIYADIYTCPKCNYETIFEDNKYCGKCGVRIRWY